jgi:hypothetical protein
LTKAKRHLNRIERVLPMEVVMRQKRKLAEHVWYQVRPAVILLSSVADSMPPHRDAVFKQRPHRFGRFHGRAVTHLSSVAGSLPPHRGAVFKQRPHRFGRRVGWSGEHVSSVAHSMPPHRGGGFKQRPQHNLLCLFRCQAAIEMSPILAQ